MHKNTWLLVLHNLPILVILTSVFCSASLMVKIFFKKRYCVAFFILSLHIWIAYVHVTMSPKFFEMLIFICFRNDELFLVNNYFIHMWFIKFHNIDWLIDRQQSLWILKLCCNCKWNAASMIDDAVHDKLLLFFLLHSRITTI